MTGIMFGRRCRSLFYSIIQNRARDNPADEVYEIQLSLHLTEF